MAKFIRYRTDTGNVVRARVVRKAPHEGALIVEPYFFQRDGTDVPGFIGGRVHIPFGEFSYIDNSEPAA